MDEIQSGPERDPVDPARVIFLGVCTMALAVVFMALVVSDNVSAMTF